MKETDKVLRFTKIGGGTVLLTVMGRKRLIKAGQTFKAYLKDIPKAFYDTIRYADGGEIEDGVEQEKPKPPEVIPELEYTIEPKAPGWFNVVSSSGKVMNEKGLRQEDAEALVKSLKE